jgi:hypothetical protein
MEQEEPNEMDEKEISKPRHRTYIAFKEKRLEQQRFILSFLPCQAGISKLFDLQAHLLPSR